MKRPYNINGRLQDVIALIQVLAYSPRTRRTEVGLKEELKRSPNNYSWAEVASQHPEFFRVREETDKSTHISLIARNAQQSVADADGDSVKPILSTDVANKLMELAVELHDKEVRRADLWKTTVIPLVVSVVAATAAIAAAVINAQNK